MNTTSCDYFMRGDSGLVASCSDNGACVAGPPNEWNPNKDGRCVCENGWSGLGDFVDGRGMDCNINISIVKIWWGIIIFMHALQFLFGLQVLQEMKAAGRVFSKDKNYRVFVAAQVEAFIRIIEGVLRIATGGMVGSHLLITLIHGIPGWIFWGYCCPSLMIGFLEITLKQSKMDRGEGAEGMAKKMAILVAVMKYQRAVAFFVFIVTPLLTLVSEDPGVLFWVSKLYYLGTAVMGVYVAFWCAIPAISAMINLIGDSNKAAPNEKMAELLTRLTIFHREVRNNGFTNALSCCVFLAFPLTFNLQTYQICFGWTLAPIIIGVAMHTLRPKKANGKVKPAGATTTTTTTTVTNDD
ncbi:hypothetical protein TL16_g06904 [Triparma laevis f. inornata]|uniref:Uncharacterized protein n=1 Tax=Triparma laevis f. inornata TaxID=1714386 RepID=A0A9W7EGK7_9STRA|nr:hypothetical protein TL16_g06904 [Triparma laevis f. inornata]